MRACRLDPHRQACIPPVECGGRFGGDDERGAMMPLENIAQSVCLAGSV
jgi:hypothetical protein